MTGVLKMIDVVEIGVEKEKAREAFYGRVADHFDDPDMKSLFTRLRDWETNHVKKFKSILASMEENETVESYPGEMSSYIRALVDDSLYKQIDADHFHEYIKNPLDAINYGIGFEKDSILLFQELMKYVQTENKDIIMQLIDEERHHIVYLIKLKQQKQ